MAGIGEFAMGVDELESFSKHPQLLFEGALNGQKIFDNQGEDFLGTVNWNSKGAEFS